MIARHEDRACGCAFCKVARFARGEQPLPLAVEEAHVLALEISMLRAVARSCASRAQRAEQRVSELEAREGPPPREVVH